jgi:NADPH:quinone reductase
MAGERRAEVRTLGSLTVSAATFLPARPPQGHVRIAVRAAGVNFADALLVAGTYQVRPPLPFAPGAECAGVVVACAENICAGSPAAFHVGDCVLALAPRFGAFATAVDVPVGNVYALPRRLLAERDFIRAAAIPVACGTAWLAWRLCGVRVRAATGLDRQAVLVTGASGGAGSAAVLLAKAMGCYVVAVARGEQKTSFCRTVLRADCVLDLVAEGGSAGLAKKIRAVVPGGVDAVFEAVGGQELFAECIRATCRGGKVAIVGFASGHIPTVSANTLLVKGVALVGVYFGADMEHRPGEARRDFSEMLDFCEQHCIDVPVMQPCFSLSDAAKAVDMLRGNRIMGKVVIVIDEAAQNDERHSLGIEDAVADRCDVRSRL